MLTQPSEPTLATIDFAQIDWTCMSCRNRPSDANPKTWTVNYDILPARILPTLVLQTLILQTLILRTNSLGAYSSDTYSLLMKPCWRRLLAKEVGLLGGRR